MYLRMLLLRGMCEVLCRTIYSVIYFSIASFVMLAGLEKYELSYCEMLLIVGG